MGMVLQLQWYSKSRITDVKSRYACLKGSGRFHSNLSGSLIPCPLCPAARTRIHVDACATTCTMVGFRGIKWQLGRDVVKTNKKKFFFKYNLRNPAGGRWYVFRGSLIPCPLWCTDTYTLTSIHKKKKESFSHFKQQYIFFFLTNIFPIDR